MAEILAWIKENPKATAIIAVLVVCLGVEAGALRKCSVGGNANTAVSAAQGVSSTAQADNHFEVVIGKTKDCPEVRVVHDCKDTVTSVVTQYVTVTAQCPTAPAFRLAVGASVPVYPLMTLGGAELEAEAGYHKINARVGVNIQGQIWAGASYTVIEF